METDSDLLLIFHSDIPGRELDSYDFSSLGVGTPVASKLAKSFRALTTTYRSVSRRQAWATIKKYSRYLSMQGDPAEAMRSRPVLKGFLEHMLGNVRRSTAISHYNFIVAIYQWLALNDAKNTIVWLNVDSSPCGMIREKDSVRRNALSVSDLSKIFSACKRDIDQIRHRMQAGEDALSGTTRGAISDKDVHTLAGIFTGLQRGVVSKRELVNLGLISHNCRYREVRRYALLGTRDFVPYIVCLICQTLSNPQSAMNIAVDCVEEHPVDPLKRRIIWDKYRASRQQAVDVTADGRYSVPNLIEDIALRTQALRQSANDFSMHLFITPSESRIRTPSIQSWHNALSDFIQAHKLPDFNFVDIRAAGAEALSNSGVGLESIQRKMQHRQARTTQQYLDRGDPSPQARSRVAKFIGAVIEEARTTNAKLYETVTGMQCSDPTSGVAPRSSVGQDCLQYLQCATCPNSVVVIDSEKHVSRMLVTLSALEKMKAQAMQSIAVRTRYQATYQATHEVVLALIAMVPTRVLASARILAADIPQLALE